MHPASEVLRRVLEALAQRAATRESVIGALGLTHPDSTGDHPASPPFPRVRLEWSDRADGYQRVTLYTDSIDVSIDPVLDALGPLDTGVPQHWSLDPPRFGQIRCEAEGILVAVSVLVKDGRVLQVTLARHRLEDVDRRV